MTIYRCKPSIGAVLNDDVYLQGLASADLQAHLEPIADQGSIDLDLVRGILDAALVKLNAAELDKETDLDQWLAPRIHSAVRVSRRLAADMGFWTWLVLETGRAYTWERWKETVAGRTRPSEYRYTGDFKRNALARLWWFAEMARNGPDYSAISDVLRNASTAQYSMELKYSMYRPAVVAFGRIATKYDLDFFAVKDFSKRINAYLSLRSLEAMGLDVPDPARDAAWWSDAPILPELLKDALPIGPRDGYADERATKDLEQWFDSIAKESLKAPRPKKKDAA